MKMKEDTQKVRYLNLNNFNNRNAKTKKDSHLIT